MAIYFSHGAFEGPNSYFSKWRYYLAFVSGLPPLGLMEGYYNNLKTVFPLPTLYTKDQENYPRMKELDYSLPIKWECLKYTPLIELLRLQDTNGTLSIDILLPLAETLESLVSKMKDEAWKRVTNKFISGLRRANKEHVPLTYH